MRRIAEQDFKKDSRNMSRRTLRDMDEEMANFRAGRVGEVLDVDALERLADRVE